MSLNKQFTKSNDQLQNLNTWTHQEEKIFQKLSRLFLAAPTTTFDESKKQLPKSPFTHWSLFRKSLSPMPSLSHQSSS